MKLTPITFVAVSLLALGMYVRLTGVLTGNFPFTFDQGRDALDVERIALGKFTLLGPHTAIGGIFLGPLYYYILLFPFLVTNGHVSGMVFFMGILGTLSLVSGYILLRKIQNTESALLFLALSGISPVLIATSRYFHNPNLITYFIVFSPYFLYKVIVEKNNKNILPLFLVSGIIMQFEYAFGLVHAIAVFGTLLIYKRTELLKLKFFYVGIAIFIFTFTPQIVFDARHDLLMTKAAISVLKGTNTDLNVGNLTLLARINERKIIPWHDFRTAVGVDSTPIGLTILILSVTGLLFFGKRNVNARRFIFVTGTLISIMVICYMLYSGPIWGWYRIGNPVLYIVITAVGLSLLWRNIPLSRILIIALICFMYYTLFARLGKEWKPEILSKQMGLYQNEEKIIDDIITDSKNETIGVMVYTPPVYDYAWDYLIRWKDKQNNNVQIMKKKQPTTYLIVEPDPEKPWRANGWLETVIKDGTIVSSTLYPDGIRLEKRLFSENEIN